MAAPLRIRRVRHVIEREADQRHGVAHRERLGAMVPRGFAKYAVEEWLEHKCLRGALAAG